MNLARAACIIALLGAANCYSIDMKKVTMNSIAEGYVKLALEIDHYDPGYVDAYYGPPEWRDSVKQPEGSPIPFQRLLDRVDALLAALDNARPRPATDLDRLRATFLRVHLNSARARIQILGGVKMNFDEESKALYDVIAPAHADINRDSLLEELDHLLPGEGLLAERLDNFLKRFYIPKSKIKPVFNAALAEAQRRTREHLELPKDESLILEFVTNQPWGGYNWFKGNGHSLVQVNIEQPVTVGSALGTLVHEGYPGHHTNLTLLEKSLYRDSGWVEFSVLPLYCPMSVVSEGIANYAHDMIFPGHEGEDFERNVLFPIAGLDTTDAELGFRIGKIRRELDKGEIEIARAYLDGKLTAAQAESSLVALAINTPTNVSRQIKFYDAYRSYIICYSLGKELVKKYVRAVPEADRWARFSNLLSMPFVPSTLK